MKILYISRNKLPSTSASSVHVARISDEFNQICDEFIAVLAGTDYDTETILQIKKIYGLKTDFPIIGIEKKESFINFTIQFAWDALKIIKREKPDVVITRDPMTAFFSVMLCRRETVLDIHGDIRQLCGRYYRLYKIKFFTQNKYFHPVAITQAVKNYYIENYKMDVSKIKVIPDGVTLESFEKVEKYEENHVIPRIGFVGSFMRDKGIDTIGRLSHIMPDVLFCLAGGDKEKAEKQTELMYGDNVKFEGYLENREVPSYIKSMDVLLLPNRESQKCNGEEIGKFTSPLKMFEYMASGVPIVASEVSALREVLSEENCFFVRDPEDVYEWKRVIAYVINNPKESKEKAEQALIDVKEFTWRNRAIKMIEHVEGK